jgi:adenine-specific DNA-methyltransferase
MMENKNFYYILNGKNEDWYEHINGRFKEKVKLVYLDPPYNTKRNRGARKEYNDKDSSWEITIKGILKKSHNYLKEDGFLAISINQTELFRLKNILDNVFDPDKKYKGNCFIGLFPVKIRHKDRQLMIGATFHNVYEYLLIYRKNPKSKFIMKGIKPRIEDYKYNIKIIDNTPIVKIIAGKKVEFYSEGKYRLEKTTPNKSNFRRYLISGKIATANWSGEFFEKHLKKNPDRTLIKVHGLENHSNGFRWFQTKDFGRKSGVYFQSFNAGGRTKQVSNEEFDYTDEVTYIYKEGGEGIDFKDSKKPEKMLNRLLEVTTKKGDLVFDLFGGSGTTIACCVKNKRSCITIEKEDKNIIIIKQRLKNLKTGKDVDKERYDFNYKSYKDYFLFQKSIKGLKY